MTAPTGGQQQLTPAQVATILALVQAQAAARRQLTRTAVAAAQAAFAPLGLWWDGDAVSAAVRSTLRIVQPAQRQAARITDAFLARVLREMTGRSVQPVGAPQITRLRRAITPEVARDLVDGRRVPQWIELGDTEAGPSGRIDDTLDEVIPRNTAMDPGEPYGRVAEQYRYQVVAQGHTEARARAKAMTRLAAVAETDVTLAVRAMYEKGLRRDQINGWRRVLHPELSESGPCGLCVVAADRIYRVEDLQPLHERCVCEVLPIVGAMDPGSVINRDDLERVYNAAGGTGGDVIKSGRRYSGALKKVRVALTEHGELGPVLVDAGQNYRGPREVAKTKVPDRATRARAQLASLEKSLPAWEAKLAAGEQAAQQPVTYHRQAIANYRRELASIT